MTAAFPTGNIVEACKIKWVVDRLDSQAFASLSKTIAKGQNARQGFILFINSLIHSFIHYARILICGSGALQQTFYGSPRACPVYAL